MKRRFRVHCRAPMYWVRRAGPRTWPGAIRTFRPRPRVQEAHVAALFHPGGDDDPPAMEVAGVLVFAYVDRRHKALRVSVDLDTVQPWLLNDAGQVPMLISVQGEDVFMADYPDRV